MAWAGALAGIGSMIGGLGSGIAGAIASNNASNNARQIAQQGIDAFNGIGVPNPQDMALNLQNYQQVGDLNPQNEALYQQGGSQFGNIQEDPRLRQAQMDALTRMQSIGNSGGMDPTAQAQLLQIQSQANQNEKAQRDAILQNAAQRGITGSGLELASDMNAQQAGANSQNMAGTNVLADAQNRALQAIQSSSAMGSQMRSQDYGEAARNAEAQDAINQFNTANRQNVSNANTQNQNAAQQYNLGLAQTTANQNTALSNQQQQYNKSLLQQQYDNQLNKARGIAGQTGVAANVVQQGGANLANTLGGLGQGLMGTGASLYNYSNAPGPAKYDATTGKALFNQQTGEQYGS